MGLAALTGTLAGATPPAANSPAAPLVEVLYGGETGAEARLQGDRIRLLVWLRSLELAPQDLAQLHAATARTQALHRQLESEISAAAAAEQAALTAPYAALEQALVEGDLSEEALEAFSHRIQAARVGLVDPRERKARFADAILNEASRVLGGWESEQRAQVADALFVLRETVGEGSTPAAFADLLGPAWKTGDFSTTRRSASPPEMDHLDIGGLWTLDAGATDRSVRIQADQQLVILALVLAHPATEGACRAMVETP